MANVRVTEYTGLGSDPNGSVQAVAGPATKEQIVAIGVLALSAGFNAATTIIRVHAEAICAIAVGGTAPVATTGTSARMIAGQTEYFRVVPGDKIAVITDT
jgi:hypothetical protein